MNEVKDSSNQVIDFYMELEITKKDKQSRNGESRAKLFKERWGVLDDCKMQGQWSGSHNEERKKDI